MPCCQMDTLLCFSKCWIQPEEYTANQVIEKVASDQFLCLLFLAMSLVVGLKAPQTPAQLTEALECALTMLEIAKSEPPKGFLEAHQLPRPHLGAKLPGRDDLSGAPMIPHHKTNPCPLNQQPLAQAPNYG